MIFQMLDLLFWFLATVVVYVYAGYPLSLYLLTRRGSAPGDQTVRYEPSVTMLISAYNEEECIAEKLDNCLELQYPNELINIVVISDASSDRTDEIVAEYADRGIQLLRMEDRGGKTVGVNAAVEKAESEIIVFSDANAMYRADAVVALASRFRDASIGAVIGEASYVEPDSDSGRSESLYWRYETAIKELESREGSVVGGDGAIYAVRRELYVPMSADALSDFVNPLQVVRAGYRCVYDRRAVSYEETASEYTKEYRRKVRIVNRAWRAVLGMPEMLNPFRHGTFSLKLWSHKVLRWIVPFLLVAIFALNVSLVTKSAVYVITLAVQVLFYALALIGLLHRDRGRLVPLLSIPFYFCLVNIASAQGILEAFKGRTYTTWSTARSDGNK